MLKFSNIIYEGETGLFRANEEQMGWKGESGSTFALPMNAVRKAEWLEGKLRILAEMEEEDGEHVVGLDGFSPGDYDALWKHFEQTSGVYIKKHKAVAAINAADFDASMIAIEDAADAVDEAQEGSVRKKACEADLMKKVEAIRDGLGHAVSGDKQALNSVFAAAGCERIGRLRLVIDTCQVEGDYRKDPRWMHLRKMTATIEGVLQEVGTYREWRPPEDSGLTRRQAARELRGKMGYEEDEPASAPLPKPKTGGVAAMAAQMAAGNMIPYGAAPQPEDVEEPPAPAPAPPPPMPEPEPAPAPAPAPAAPARGVGAVADSDSSDDDRGNLFEDAAPQGPIAGATGGRGDNDEEVSDPNARSAAPAGEDRRFKRLIGAAIEGHEDAFDERGRAYRMYPNSIVEGWTWKQSRWLKRWKRRYLVLTPESLMTFRQRERGGTGDKRDRRDPPATEIFQASSVKICVGIPDGQMAGRINVFAVGTGTRDKDRQFIICDSNEDRDIWVREIRKAFNVHVGFNVDVGEGGEGCSQKGATPASAPAAPARGVGAVADSDISDDDRGNLFEDSDEDRRRRQQGPIAGATVAEGCSQNGAMPSILAACQS